MPKQFSQKWKATFFAICFFLFMEEGISSPEIMGDSYITDYERSHLGRYKVISRNTEGNRWQIETDWKGGRRSSEGPIVRHEYERVLFEKRKIEKAFQYDIDFESYELDEEIETKILNFYTIDGRPDHDEVELIDFSTYPKPICGMKSALIMLRVGLSQEERAARAKAGYPIRRYYYDHIFINLEKNGEAVFYPDPLDSSIIDGPILHYFNRWFEKAEYNCQSGFLTFE